MQRVITVWKWVGENEKQIKIVFTLIASMYVIFQYQAKIRQDRIANSMDYTHRYTSEPILPMKERLDSFWLSKQVQEVSRKLQAEPNSAVRFKRYNEVIPQLLQTSGRDRDVYGILQFYRDVGLCIQANRCYYKTACDYFFVDMLSFRSNYRPLLEEWTLTLGETAPAELSELIQHTCRENFVQFCKEHPTSNHCKSRGLESK